MSVESTGDKIRDVQSEMLDFDTAELKSLRNYLGATYFSVVGEGTDASTGDTPHSLFLKGPDVAP